MRRILIVINPKAGKAKAIRNVKDVVKYFQKYNYSTTIYFTKANTYKNDIKSLLKDEYVYIVCIGGDGTVSLLENFLLEFKKDIPIMYFACGTTNDFARTIRTNMSIKDNLNRIKEFKIHRHDVAKTEVGYFNYVLALGALVNASSKTSRKAKNYFGSLSYIMRAIKEIKNIHSFYMKINVDGVEYSGEYVLVMITNSYFVGSFELPEKEYIKLDDGKFEIYLLKMPKKLSKWRSILKNLIKHKYPEDMNILRGSNIKIEYYDKNIGATFDGEDVNIFSGITIEVKKKAIRFLY